MLALAEVTVTFSGSTAVDAVTLTVSSGCVLALLGPSGCGKSTLLRSVAGLEPLRRGRIEWDGVDLARIPVHRRGFGLMFQDSVLFPHRNVAQNVAYGLRAVGLRGAVADRRVAELLDLVGLGGFGDRSVTELSGGEAQRVALARALAPRPRLLLLDEPLAALDRSLRDALLADLRAILAETSTTAIFVTHDQQEAFAVADRVALMRAGRLVQTGTPADVWAAPVDEWAAGFVGYPAVVDGVVETRSDGSYCARTDVGSVSLPQGLEVDDDVDAQRQDRGRSPLDGGPMSTEPAPPGPVSAGPAVGSTVRVALRPAALVVDSHGSLVAHCLAVVPGPDLTLLTVAIDDLPTTGMPPGSALSAVAHRECEVAVGQAVRLRFDPSAAAVVGIRSPAP